MSEGIVLGGTDGFRGRFTQEPGDGLMNEGTVAGLTYALVRHQYEQSGMEEGGLVVVGQDTRVSSQMLSEAAMAGAQAAGAEVAYLSVAPTPMVQRAAQELGDENNVLAAVAITASHNPAEYNGWKGMPEGRKPSRSVVQAISQRYWGQVESGLTIPVSSTQEVPISREVRRAYQNDVVKSIEKEFGEKPLEGKLFVVDGANGAAQAITPAIFRRLGADVREYSCDGRGEINDGCGAAHLEGVQDFLSRDPDIVWNPDFVGAIANDGDADRMMAVGVVKRADGSRELVEVNGNHVMLALAQGEPGIVGTEYTNSGLVERLKEERIGFEFCPNGDVFVTEALLVKQAQGEKWKRGGEFTGHLVDLNWLLSGDGVRMAAWFAAWTVQQEKTFGQVYQELPLWKEVMVNVAFPSEGRQEITEDTMVVNALRRAQEQNHGSARLILRASGTEPLVRVYGQGENAELITQVVHSLADVVRARAVV